MAAALVLMLLGTPIYDSFDEPLDPVRWYVGTGLPPAKGVLRLQKSGWIVSRHVPDDTVRRIDVVFRHRGGDLELTFHDAREPLSSPKGTALRVKKGAGERRLVVTREGATVDGADVDWKGELLGTFRLCAARGDVELLEVSVEPRVGEPPQPTLLERNTVLFATTPPGYVDDGGHRYVRASLLLWDVEVCFLLRRGPVAFTPLRGPPRDAPVLAALVTAGDAAEWHRKARANALAMSDWGDERRHLAPADFVRYVDSEFAVYALLQDAQRALNLVARGRSARDLEPLVHLAMIRHTPNAHSAIGLSEVQGAKAALAALRKALGRGTDPARAGPDQLRQAAADAARAILGEPPPEWPGFSFDPSNRFVTIEAAKDLVR